MEQLKNIYKQLFSWQGDVGRGVYASTGFVLFFFKWNLDRIISGYFFSITWLPYQYLMPDIGLQDKKNLALMLSLTALPFIYLGILLTVKRLRAIGAPTFLAVLFFIPFVNLIFFMVLSMLPNRIIKEKPSPKRHNRVLGDGSAQPRCVTHTHYSRSRLIENTNLCRLPSLFGLPTARGAGAHEARPRRGA